MVCRSAPPEGNDDAVGGIDSPVAAYLALKRGVSLEMVHFYSPPYTSEQALAKAKELTGKLAKYSGSIKFIQVPFTEIQETVKEKVPEGYLMTVQRRLMLRLACALAQKRAGLAVFNGESLGQVASQTMESMLAIEDVTTMPVLRPVLSYDKTRSSRSPKTSTPTTCRSCLTKTAAPSSRRLRQRPSQT